MLMQQELRNTIRQAVDAHARARRQTFVDHGELQVCPECAGDLDAQTLGCRRCSERHYRLHPAVQQARRERERLSQRRHRERART